MSGTPHPSQDGENTAPVQTQDNRGEPSERMPFRARTVYGKGEKRTAQELMDRAIAEEFRIPSEGQLSLEMLPANRVLHFFTPLAHAILGKEQGNRCIATVRGYLERRRRRLLERRALLLQRLAEEQHMRRERQRARERERKERALAQRRQEEAKRRAQEEVKAREEAARKRAREERTKARAAAAKARAEQWKKILAPFTKAREHFSVWRREQAVRRAQARAERGRRREERRKKQEEAKRAQEEARKRREEERQRLEEEKRRREEEAKNERTRAAEEARRKREEALEQRRRARAARLTAWKTQLQHLFRGAPQQPPKEGAPPSIDEGRIREEATKEAMRQILIEQEKARLRSDAAPSDRILVRAGKATPDTQEAPTPAPAAPPRMDSAALEKARAEVAAERAQVEALREILSQQLRKLEEERAALEASKTEAAQEPTTDAKRREEERREWERTLAQERATFEMEKEHIRAEALAEAEAKLGVERTQPSGGKEAQPSSALREELEKWKKQVALLEQERRELEQRRTLQEEQERARKEKERLEEERLELERQRLRREREALEEEKVHKARIAEGIAELKEEETQLQAEQKKLSLAATPVAPSKPRATPPPEKKKEQEEEPSIDIGHILLAQNYVSEEELHDALAKSKERNVTLELILKDEGLVTKELLQNAIAEYYRMPFVDLRSQPPDPAALELLPHAFSASFSAVAIQTLEDGTLVVATNAPERPTLLAEIQKALPSVSQVSLVYTSKESIESALGFYRKPLETRFRSIIKQHKKVAPEIIEEIFSDAIQLGASDIHFEPQEKVIIVRFRVDGVMHEAGRIPKEYYEGIVNRTKIAGNMRIDEHFSAQDGAIRWRSEKGKAMDVRVSIVPIVDGEKIVLRLLSEYVRTLTLGDLGFTPAQRELLIEASNKPFGMLLTTGPTGSGKSTTLYGLMKICNTPDVNISTIEDPVEYKIPGINHIQVNTKTDLTFERGLRALVRQDPDIILVGEIRDNITAQISVNAALTGHLLFSTLHANDAATAIPRLLEMGVEPYLLASTLELIIAQRLMRRICLHCRHSSTLRRDQACSLFPGAERYFDPSEQQVTLYRGKGCPACGGTGFRGRIGLYELLDVTPRIEEMIVERRTTAEINTVARREGMATLFEDGLQKVKAGLSTIDELLRVAAPPEPLPESSSAPPRTKR